MSLHNVVFDVLKPRRTQKFSDSNHATLPEFEEICLKNCPNYVGEVKKGFKNVIFEPAKLNLFKTKKSFVAFVNIQIEANEK